MVNGRRPVRLRGSTRVLQNDTAVGTQASARESLINQKVRCATVLGEVAAVLVVREKNIA